MKQYYDSITEFVFVEDPPENADIIFLPGGEYPQGAEYAAQLFHQGLSPFIIPSGKYSIAKTGFGGGEWTSEWEYLRKILTDHGVPDSAILKEDQATFTWENAIYSRKVIGEKGLTIRKAILVCQAFHARRALTYYPQQCPDLRILVCPVVTRGISRDNWFLDRDKTRVVLGELKRCGEQFSCFLPVGDPLGYEA